MQAPRRFRKGNYIHTREQTPGLSKDSPSPVSLKGMPTVGKANHDKVYIEYDINAKRIQQAQWKINLYKRANMDGLRYL